MLPISSTSTEEHISMEVMLFIIDKSDFLLYADNTGGHKRKINTASVVTISVIVTLAIVGCVWLLYFCKKKAPWKPKPSPSKNYVPQFSNV